MPDQHKLTREEHKAAVVKFTQELTDHPAGQCWQRLRVKLILIDSASSVKAVSGGDVMSDDESAGLDGKLTPSPSMASAWGCAQRTAALIGVVSQRSCAATGFIRAAPYKLENREAMLAVTVTKRPTVTYRSGWMATAPPKVICGRSEK